MSTSVIAKVQTFNTCHEHKYTRPLHRHTHTRAHTTGYLYQHIYIIQYAYRYIDIIFPRGVYH